MWKFNVGDRVVMQDQRDDPDPLPAGTPGTVTRVSEHDSGDGWFVQLFIRWDNGQDLTAVMPPDVVVRESE